MEEQYKVNTKYIVQIIDTKTVVFDPDESNLFTLNEMAATILHQYLKGKSTKQVKQFILDKYNVEEKTLSIDFSKFLQQLVNNKILLRVLS